MRLRMHDQGRFRSPCLLMALNSESESRPSARRLHFSSPPLRARMDAPPTRTDRHERCIPHAAVVRKPCDPRSWRPNPVGAAWDQRVKGANAESQTDPSSPPRGIASLRFASLLARRAAR